MRIFLVLHLLNFLTWTDVDPNKIARINKLKTKGEEGFKAGNWQKAVESYSYLLDTLGHYEDEIALNLGHAYLNLSDTSMATGTYQRLATSTNGKLKSKAYQQLGFISTTTQQLDIALSLFKASLIADPHNEVSRYNYELIKKLLDQQHKEEKKDDLKKPDEPSDYAKELKKQAERLAAQLKYDRAVRLMDEGLKVDPSVAYFKDFYQRLVDIAQILKTTQ